MIQIKNQDIICLRNPRALSFAYGGNIMIAGKFNMVEFDPDKKCLYKESIQSSCNDFDDSKNGFKADGKIYMKGHLYPHHRPYR